MSKEQYAMLQELMELNFCIIETAMYLDTHPADERAIGLHNSYVARYKKLNEAYNMKFSMLTSEDYSKCPWEFINSPWPWEIDYCDCR